MGACFSKSDNRVSPSNPDENLALSTVPEIRNGHGNSRVAGAVVARPPRSSFTRNPEKAAASNSNGRGNISSHGSPNTGVNIPFTQRTVDWLVLQSQLHLRSSILLGVVPMDPVALVMLSDIAEVDDGYLLIITSLVNGFQITEGPLVPDFVPFVLDACDLPTKEMASTLGRFLDLKHQKYTTTQKKNICLILLHMAVAMGGQNTALLTDEVMEFLLSQLTIKNKPILILHAIMVLEKLARTGENKNLITRALNELPSHPLIRLEKWKRASLNIKRQVGFCAQWALDNLFLAPARPFGYERVNNALVHVILNSVDSSPYLKISPDGLEARCDAATFESARSTFQADNGTWFYEAQILTNGIMQIGWASKSTKFLNHEQLGVGDEPFSVAYDGSRKQIWHNASMEKVEMRNWNVGDIVGTHLDLEKLEVIFFLNGEIVNTHTNVFEHVRTGFFAAASLTDSQQCVFNFGHRPFKYPPADKHFNNFGQLGQEHYNKVVLPKHIRLQHEAMSIRRMSSVRENSCTICCDHPASIQLSPCNHSGLCSICADQLKNCPVCRQQIESKIIIVQH